MRVLWLPLVASSFPPLGPLAILATSVSPVGSVSGDIVSYILGFGPLGVGIVLFGLGIIVPKSVMNAAVDHSRADLVEENKRLIAQVEKVEAQRDEAVRIAQERVVPLLVSFNGTAAALLPILQDMVRSQEQQRRP